jgi:outer membrane lipoprotein-sorting protein
MSVVRPFACRAVAGLAAALAGAVLLLPQARADQAREAAEQARELVDLLRSVEGRYRSLGPFRVSFEMIYESPAFGVEDVEKGVIHVDPPQRMLWLYDPTEDQPARRAVLDGRTWWHVDPGLEQVRRFERPPGAPDPLNDLLAGRLDLLAVFSASPSLDPAEEEALAVVELIPREPREDLELAVAQIDRRSGDLRRLDVIDPLGSRMIVRLSAPEPERALPDESFEVAVPEGYTLIRE